MKKILFLFFAFSIFASQSWAVIYIQSSSSTSECDGKIVCQNFEGVGYDNGETWIETSYTDEDFTDTILRGAESMASGNQSGTGGGSVYTVVSGSEMWGHFLYRQDTNVAAGDYFFSIRESDGSTNVFRIYQNSNGTLAMRLGSSFVSYTTDAVSADMTYHIWWHYKEGTGDAEGQLKFTPISTMSRGAWTGSAALSKTDGTAGTAARMYFEGDSLDNFFLIVDQVLVSNSDIPVVDP